MHYRAQTRTAIYAQTPTIPKRHTPLHTKTTNTDNCKHGCPLQKSALHRQIRWTNRNRHHITSGQKKSICKQLSKGFGSRGTKQCSNQKRVNRTPPNNLHAAVPFACRQNILLCFVRMDKLLRRGLFWIIGRLTVSLVVGSSGG